MNIGELDSRIKVMHETVITNSLEEEAPQLEVLKEIWAKVEPRTGSLLTGRAADTKLSKTTHAITVRVTSLKGITEDCHILWTDQNGAEHHFDIDYILPPPRSTQFTTIYAQEVI